MLLTRIDAEKMYVIAEIVTKKVKSKTSINNDKHTQSLSSLRLYAASCKI